MKKLIYNIYYYYFPKKTSKNDDRFCLNMHPQYIPYDVITKPSIKIKEENIKYKCI